MKLLVGRGLLVCASEWFTVVGNLEILSLGNDLLTCELTRALLKKKGNLPLTCHCVTCSWMFTKKKYLSAWFFFRILLLIACLYQVGYTIKVEKSMSDRKFLNFEWNQRKRYLAKRNAIYRCHYFCENTKLSNLSLLSADKKKVMFCQQFSRTLSNYLLVIMYLFSSPLM